MNAEQNNAPLIDFGELERLSSGTLPDSIMVYRCKDGTVLNVSPPAFPSVVRETTDKILSARAALGDELGWAAPVVISQWETDGVTSALIEELTPLSRNRLKRFIQLKRVVPAVLAWLRKVAGVDRGANDQLETCLNALAGCPYPLLAQAAKEAIDALSSASFAARSVVMHSDMWLGNIMLDSDGSREFVLIDWGGSSVDGFPIFDLVRFAQSAKLRPKTLQRELAAHAERLGCSISETRIYLLAALGCIWIHLEQFPPERFNAMAEGCLRTIGDALNA